MSTVDEDSPPRSGPFPLAERALDALGDACQIPPELEEHILAGVLAADPPSLEADEPPTIEPDELPLPGTRVEYEPAAPLANVIALGRRDKARWRWAGPLLAAAAVLVMVSATLLARPGPFRSVTAGPTAVRLSEPPPAGIHGRRVPDESPRFVEARRTLFLVAQRVEKVCQAGAFSATVLFEHSGEATVIDLSVRQGTELQCVRDELGGARVSPSAEERLIVLYEHRRGTSDDGTGMRARAWLVEDS